MPSRGNSDNGQLIGTISECDLPMYEEAGEAGPSISSRLPSTTDIYPEILNLEGMSDLELERTDLHSCDLSDAIAPSIKLYKNLIESTEFTEIEHKSNDQSQLLPSALAIKLNNEESQENRMNHSPELPEIIVNTAKIQEESNEIFHLDLHPYTQFDSQRPCDEKNTGRSLSLQDEFCESKETKCYGDLHAEYDFPLKSEFTNHVISRELSPSKSIYVAFSSSLLSGGDAQLETPAENSMIHSSIESEIEFSSKEAKSNSNNTIGISPGDIKNLAINQNEEEDRVALLNSEWTELNLESDSLFDSLHSLDSEEEV